MTITPPRPGSITVGLDGPDSSDGSSAALAWAAREASLEARQLRLAHSTRAHVPWTAAESELVELSEAAEEQGERVLDAAVGWVTRHHPTLWVTTMHLHDHPARDLVRMSHDAAMVVLGSRGRSAIVAMLDGSVGAAVASRAECPVVVVRSPDDRGTGVVCAVEGTGDAHQVVEFGLRYASLHRLPLAVLRCHASSDGSSPDLVAVRADVPTDDDRGIAEIRRLVGEVVGDLAQKFPDVDLTLELEHGRVRSVLPRRTRTADLVVVGRTRHHGVLSLLHPAVAGPLVEHASGTIAVVPVPG
ncbi:universal stress protein [Nocardioides rubriscoriae]|uniref:universal stress protein n=1 Tax=Nocardioides rubriscoriae TaxID=642762 RepID=UPI0011DFB687|nr:universal stress protein [Nocardioides rubriscoriae]